MNTTFANIPLHQKMESRTAGVLEMHAVDAAARGLVTGDAVEVFNGRGSLRLVVPGAGDGAGRGGGGSAGLEQARGGRECECADERDADGYWGRGYVLLDAGGGCGG